MSSFMAINLDSFRAKSSTWFYKFRNVLWNVKVLGWWYFNALLREQTVNCRAKTNPLFYHLKNFISEGHEVGNKQPATFNSSFFQSTIILQLLCRFFSHRTISKLKQSLGAQRDFKVYCTKEYKPNQVGHSPGIRHPGPSPALRTL